MDNENDIGRFLEAQADRWSGYDIALSEIRKGRKISHWIWYVFPQLRGLGESRRSYFFGLSGRPEAEAYLAHPVLGKRLREISEALLDWRDRSAERIFGGLDAMKVRSSMTLFDSISPNDVFGRVLEQFYGGGVIPIR